MTTASILDGVRVLDFTRVVAGPYATMLMGDLGADVVKVERPGTGDDCRGWGPPFVEGHSAYFLAVNRNKRSVTIDLATDEGRRLALALVAESDVVVESFRPGTLDRLGLGWDELRDRRPDLVLCSITGFGQNGPYRDRAGYDVMVSAMGGLMGLTGTPGGPPVKVGVALTDVATGLYAYSSMLAALLHRERTGQGQRLDVSLLGTQLAVLINAASNYLLAGQVMGPQGSGHASIVPYQAFETADGHVMVGAANDKLFRLLAHELELDELADLPRFATNATRVEHRDEIVPLLQKRLLKDTTAGWVRRLGEAGVAVAPINRMDEVMADPHVVASGQLQTVEHPEAGTLRLVGPAVEFSAAPAVIRRPPPLLGQHTDEILRDVAGCSPEQIAALRDRGVV